MKLTTTLLIFTAVVCTSRSEAFLFDNDDSKVGSLLQSVKDNVKKATELNPLQAISDSIDKAVDLLKAGLNNAKEQAEQVSEKVQQAAKKVNENIKEAVNNVKESVEERVKELTKKAEGEGVDVSECKSVVKTIAEAATTTVKKTVSCVSGTIGNAKDALLQAFTSGRQKLDELQALKKETEDCRNKYQGLLLSLVSATCQTKVKTQTVWLTATAAPAVIKDLVLAAKEMATLPTTLTSCLSKTPILALTEQGAKVVDNVKQCVAEKTGKKTEVKEESTGEEKKVDRNPLNWLKNKLF